MFRSRACLRDAARRALPSGSHHRPGVSPVAYVRAPIHHAQQRACYATLSDKKGSSDSKAAADLIKVELYKLAETMKKAGMHHYTDWSHEKLKKMVYVDYPLPDDDCFYIDVPFHEGKLPGGATSSFPLLTEDEMIFYQTPYKEWAPAPHKALPYSCQDKLQALYLTHGYEQPPARLHVLRKKLWHGMVPLSRERWLAKRLDDPKNYKVFMELMYDITKLFDYLNLEQMLEKRRDAFNSTVEPLLEFERALNLRREQMGVEERLDMAGMWAEYHQAILSTMSERTHRWLVDRVEEIQARAFAEFTAKLEKHKGDSKAIGLASRDYYECVQDLNAMMTRADYRLGVSMVGFKGHAPSNDFSDLPVQLRKDTYLKIGDTLDWTHSMKIMEAQDRDGPEPPSNLETMLDESKNGRKPAAPRFENPEPFIGHYTESRRNRVAMRKGLRGEPKALGEEYWITVLKSRMEYFLESAKSDNIKGFGFVCYRLTYQQTPAEWAEFEGKFAESTSVSGEWIEGYDTIKHRRATVFIDGRDFGIAEGDVEAAKKHFKETFNAMPDPGRVWTMDFLVVDQQSYESHVKPMEEERTVPPPFKPGFGDHGGFVKLVDTMEYATEKIDALAPGYTGEMRVLSSLLFEDVYPLIATNAVRPIDMWPAARLHTKQVYVGHTLGSQESWWEWLRLDLAAPMHTWMRYLKEGEPNLRPWKK